MAEFAVARGLDLPPPVVEAIDRLEVSTERRGDVDGNGKALTLAELMRLNARLAAGVAPAEPHAILKFYEDRIRHPFLHAFGDCPLVRYLGAVCVLSLIATLSVSLSPYVNGNSESFSLTASSGLPLLINEGFLLCAASLGASFAALFRLHVYIVEGTYDTKYDADYWAKYMLGLIAGTVLALLIPINEIIGPHASAAAIPLDGLGKPLLALLGGFSSSLVYLALSQMVLAMETILRGDPRKSTQAKVTAEKVSSQERAMRDRQQWAFQIMGIVRLLEDGREAAAIRPRLEHLLDVMINGHGADALGGRDNGAQSKPRS